VSEFAQFPHAVPRLSLDNTSSPDEVRAFEDGDLNARAYTVLAAMQASAVKMGTFGFSLSSIAFNDELLTIPYLAEKIMTVLNFAGNRAIMIGIALGIVSTSLKVIVGIDRSYLGSG
jgi:hypothetical protein